MSTDEYISSIEFSVQELMKINEIDDYDVASFLSRVRELDSGVPDPSGQHEVLQELDKELIKMEKLMVDWRTHVIPLLDGIAVMSVRGDPPQSVFDFTVSLTTMKDRCDEYAVARSVGSSGTKLTNLSKEKCPKCGNKTLVPKSSQDRSADEGETQYKECATDECDFTSHPKKKKAKANELGIDDI